MRIEIRRSTRNFVILVAILVVMVQGALASEPSYGGSIVVDGDSSEWDLNNDFFADMYKAGNPTHQNAELLSKLYLRYDCTDGTLYAMVLLQNGVIDDFDPEEHFIKLDGNDDVLVNGNGNLVFLPNGNGWEASASYSGQHTLNVHTLVNMNPSGDSDETSSIRDVPLEITCDPFIPEFPTIALPIAAILGLMFIFGRKREL